ncbi:MAG: hypothetical protein BroJett040_00810 [Oligoflexia bacterium]|nr:MAG: hypothetical protein BroJett040_00810 [Oligoflexia bacterium]
MIITTSICSNYLGKALALGESVKKYNPEAKFIISLVEDSIPDLSQYRNNYDEVVLSKDLGFKNFQSFIFRHSIVEASTAVKGQLFRYLMSAYPEEDKFVYIDPDCLVFAPLESLNKRLDDNEIVLTPHLLSPGNVQMEISCLKHGVFNLGFLGIRRGAEGERFVNWWAERLYRYCYEDFESGLFTDQKWINLAPCFFNICIFRDPGYNFATWNFMERRLSKVNGNFYVDEKYPLTFVHFSGFDRGTFGWANSQWAPIDRQHLGVELSEIYSNAVARNGESTFKKIPWGYNRFLSGTEIGKTHRQAFREHFKTNPQAEDINPFESEMSPFVHLSKAKNSGLRPRIISKIKRMISL